MRSRNLSGWRLAWTSAGCGFLFAAALVAAPVDRPLTTTISGLIQHRSPSGAVHTALILPAPRAPQIAAVPHDHFIIVDTSASQTGPFRTRSLAAATLFCQALPATDRVCLIVADVAATKLTPGLCAPDSKELQNAFDQLEDRVPLGSSNVETALRTALSGIQANRASSVLYVGDGFSTTQLVQMDSMQKLVSDLRAAKMPVNSLAIGPRLDLLLMGSLAQHTGGLMVVDEIPAVAGLEATPGELSITMKNLARAAAAPIFYPSSLVASPAIPSLLPQVLPPIRFDRETVLIGKDLVAGKVHIQMTGTLGGKAFDNSWTLAPERTNGSTGFVTQAWNLAEGTQGMAMPWAGRELMARSRAAYRAQVESLTQAGMRSLNLKKSQQVEQIAQTLDQLDPNNRDAQQLLLDSRKLEAKPIARKRVLVQAEDKPVANDVEPVVPAVDAAPVVDAVPEVDAAPAVEEAVPVAPAPAPADALNDKTDASNPKTESLLDELETRRKVREEQLTIDVNLAIEAANQGARESYLDAQDILKRQLDTVIAATDISGDTRQALRKRLEVSVQKLQNESETFEQQRAALDRKLSTQEAQKKLALQAERDSAKMEQLIDRVRALMARGFKGNAAAFQDAENVSRVAVELDPYNGVPNLDVFNTEAAGALDTARRLRALRADKLLATLNEVELSHVPFPDEPPVIWPSPERWQWITENRRKWKSVDLKTYSKKEEKIVQELEKPTSFDFADESLDNVREALMERHGFDIVLDRIKLEDETISTDATDITLKVNEISLKNALKLLLDAKSLTYVVENEVMKITTKTDGILKQSIRVYSVGDLVMPINPLFGQGGGGGGGMGGGMGGMGGGMGGMGGGMGGMGGGMGGMGGGGMGMGGGMGGMGGGMFSLPPVKANNQPKPAVGDGGP